MDTHWASDIWGLESFQGGSVKSKWLQAHRNMALKQGYCMAPKSTKEMEPNTGPEASYSVHTRHSPEKQPTSSIWDTPKKQGQSQAYRAIMVYWCCRSLERITQHKSLLHFGTCRPEIIFLLSMNGLCSSWVFISSGDFETGCRLPIKNKGDKGSISTHQCDSALMFGKKKWFSFS